MLNGPWRIQIGFPNHALNATYSGGAWVEGELGLDALRDPLLGRVARSVDAKTTSTVMDVTLDRHRAIGIAALVAHTGSVSGQWRLTAWASVERTGDPIRDSGWQDLHPRIFSQGQIPWGEPNWWSLRPLAEDIGRVTTITRPILFDPPVRAMWWRLEILDPDNPARSVDVGKLFLGGTLALPFNYSRGAGLTVLDLSRMAESEDGSRHYEERRRRRRMSLPFQLLDMNRDFAMWFDFLADAGISRELLIVPDPTDLANLQRRSFVATLRDPSPMEQVLTGHFSNTLIAEEV